MDFSDKLHLLMSILNVNNSKLARALKIDPSLVSKWRNKKRTPAAKSPYIANMAHYFSSLQLNTLQREQLFKLLEERAALTDRHDPARVLEALVAWLTPEEIQPVMGRHTGASAFVDVIAQIFTEAATDTPAAFAKPELSKPESVSELQSRHQFELYRGREGMRQAVLAFLEEALSATEPLELLLLSQEDMQWIIEDKSFTAQWGQQLHYLLEKGHKITIIHSTDREISELISIMNYWLPLHLTGNLDSYYFPKYYHNAIKATYFIIKDRTSIVSFSPEGVKSENYAFLFRDPVVTNVFQSGFYAFLLQCKKLLHVYTSSRMLPLLEQIVALESHEGEQLTFKSQFSSITLSQPLYEKILQENGIPLQERQKLLNLHETRLENFHNNIRHYGYSEVFPQNVFHTLPGAVNYRFSATECFTPHHLQLTRGQLSTYLEETIQVLQENERYNIFLAAETENHLLRDTQLGFIYKENHGVVASTHTFPQKGPVAIMSSENNITLAFERFFQNLFVEIPAMNRTKEHVITRLKKVLARL